MLNQAVSSGSLALKPRNVASLPRPAVAAVAGRNTLTQSSRLPVQCRANGVAAAAQTQLALHCGETTIQMPFTPDQGKSLDAALSKLLQTFAEKQAAARPKRWEQMELRFSSEQPGQGLDLLEVFCNPNSYKTAFDAKLMITAKSAGLKVVCEGRLSNLKADVDAFVKDNCS